MTTRATAKTEEPKPLIGRLTDIMAELPDVKPEGKNQHFNYKFIQSTQILGLLRPRLAKANILIVPTDIEELEPIELTTQKGGRSLLSRMKVHFSIVDGYSGETISGVAIGYGDDSGDKGANKAYTAALKNFLIKLFLIGGDADLEEDEAADKRAKARESGTTGRDVVIGSVDKIEVEKGGRSKLITDQQLTQIGRFMTDLMMSPEAFSKFAIMAFPDAKVEADFKAIREWLGGLSADDAGKLIQSLDEWATMEEQAEQPKKDAS